MTNSAFQGGGFAIRWAWALAIHLKMCVAKAESVLKSISPP